MSKAQREAWKKCSEWIREKSLYGIMPHEIDAEAERRYPDSPLGNVREIVVEYLKDNGYDGLFREGVCNMGCETTDKWFATCSELSDCRPGVLKDGKIVEREG